VGGLERVVALYPDNGGRNDELMDVADGTVRKDISVLDVTSWSGVEACDPLDVARARERGRLITQILFARVAGERTHY
jgi:hypothetical protein